MRQRIRTLTAPGDIALPFTLAEARKELRVEASDADEDALITSKIHAAMEWVERYTSQVLSPRTFELSLDAFPVLPELIELPRAPVTAIGGISYTSADDGTSIALVEADWRWSDSDPEWLRPAFRTAWPSAADERGSVKVTFEAGYEAGLVPPALLGAVRMMLVHLYENREAVVTGSVATEMPLGVKEQLRPFRRLLI